METQPTMAPAPSKLGGPTVDTPNYAKPSCYGQETVTQNAAQQLRDVRRDRQPS
jgi:hypothetical protein